MLLKNRDLKALLLSIFFFSLSANGSYSIFNNLFSQKKPISPFLKNNKDLITASSEGDLKGVEEALKKGADVNAVDYRGDSALMTAKTKAIAELLLNNRAYVELSNERGENALILHSKTNDIEIIKLLLKEGADVNKKTLVKRTALMEASFKGNKDVVFLLIAEGADVNAVSKSGDTSLVLAIINNHTEVARILLDHGADTEIPNQAGWTAKTAAKYFKQTNLLQEIASKESHQLPCKTIFR